MSACSSLSMRAFTDWGHGTRVGGARRAGEGGGGPRGAAPCHGFVIVVSNVFFHLPHHWQGHQPNQQKYEGVFAF